MHSSGSSSCKHYRQNIPLAVFNDLSKPMNHPTSGVDPNLYINKRSTLGFSLLMTLAPTGRTLKDDRGEGATTVTFLFPPSLIPSRVPPHSGKGGALSEGRLASLLTQGPTEFPGCCVLPRATNNVYRPSNQDPITHGPNTT